MLRHMSGRVSRAGAVILHEIAKGGFTQQRPEGNERGRWVFAKRVQVEKERRSKDIQEGGDIHIPMADS